MPVVQKDLEREYRIMMEIIVDANGPEEQALGWYYFLQDNITFPFRAICIRETEIALRPWRQGENSGEYGP